MRKMERLHSELFQDLGLADLRRAAPAGGSESFTEKDFGTHNAVTGNPDIVREFDPGQSD